MILKQQVLPCRDHYYSLCKLCQILLLMPWRLRREVNKGHGVDYGGKKAHCVPCAKLPFHMQSPCREIK